MFARFSETKGQFAFSIDDNGGVEISAEEHAALLAWQAAGKVVSVGANGAPVLTEPHPAKTIFACFSESDGRFAFSDENNGGVEISSEDHAALMAGQALGRVICRGTEGTPVLCDPQFTADERIAALTAHVQAELDAAARVLGYDDIKTAITYADEPSVPRFQVQGQALRAWRSLVWARFHDVLAQREAQHLPEPIAEELIALLPALELPG